jgi:hypothetical protein
MSVNFSHIFETKLPNEIRDELKKWNLLDKKVVDVFWVIQPLSSLGGNEHGYDQNITYVKAHGWADPDEPLSYQGTRVHRNFLYGIYRPTVDISYEVKLNELKPFLVFVHDGLYSPQTAAIRLPSAHPDSLVFWTLVIDHENPNKELRALATLHWLLSEKHEPIFLAEHYIVKDIIDSKGKEITKRAINYNTIGDFIANLQTTSFLKNTQLVNELTSLVGKVTP